MLSDVSSSGPVAYTDVRQQAPHVIVIRQSTAAPQRPSKRIFALCALGAAAILLLCMKQAASPSFNSAQSSMPAGNTPAGNMGDTTHSDLHPTNGKTDRTHAFFLVDRTGSMASMADAVREGFNAYVQAQQRQPGKMRLTLVQFDSQEPCEVVIEAADINSVQPLQSFSPRGTTPLYDSIAKTIALAKSSMHRDESVALIVFTDGGENASREYDRRSVFKLIEDQKAAGWTFVFLGANQDSYATGGTLGYSAGSTSNFVATPQGARAAWKDLSASSLNWRGNVKAGTYTRAKASNWLSSREAEAQMNSAH